MYVATLKWDTPAAKAWLSGYRYRNIPRWIDGTMAYYTKHLQQGGGNNCQYEIVRNRQQLDICPLLELKWVLCEAGRTAEGNHPDQSEDADTRVKQLSSPFNSSIHVKHVVCPSGHWTHAFLACDVKSACWQHDDTGQSSGRGMVASLCQSPLTTMFSCRTDVGHVPYSLVCDHNQDCLDNSDEDFCVHPPCTGSWQFECLNKQVRNTKEV